MIVYSRISQPGIIDSIAGSNQCKLLIGSAESERHPDISIYLKPRPKVTDVWSHWLPEIAIEVVSRSSSKRDYEDECGEYMELGMSEYWTVDSMKSQMTANIRWRGLWKPKVVKGSQKYTTPCSLGFRSI